MEYTALPNGAVKVWGFTDRHDVVLEGLTSGTNYSIRVLVMSSLNQRTDWSGAVQHMST